MAVYILRRLVAAFFILIGASFIVYILTTQAGDPLSFTLSITNPTQRAGVVKTVTETLSLNDHPVVRYLHWLHRLIFLRDFGLVSTTQQPVWDELELRIPLTLKLVTAATLMSVVVGVAVGIVTALRQYSGFDYLITLFTFVFFALPVFWVAVILKDWGGINFNDWLRDGAHFSVTFIVMMSTVAAIIGSMVSGGRWPRKAAFGLVAGGATAVVLSWISSSQWLLHPEFGPVGYAVLAVGIAAGVVAVMAGWRNVRARRTALVTAAIGIVLYLPLQRVFDRDVNVWSILGLGVLAVVVGVTVGCAWGGEDKGQSARVGAVTALLLSVVMFVDRTMQSWDEYSASSVIRNRPIKTIGDRETRLTGSFWVITNDTFSHLILPTLALMLGSVAVYTRYSRASMLEVLNQDYVRTARAKGLTNRTVVVRHALRNALIPLATIVAFDISAIIGGAVITESVFEWKGMGRLFIDGLREYDPNRVMAFFVVTGIFAVVFNLLADITYTVLDPRIRLGK